MCRLAFLASFLPATALLAAEVVSPTPIELPREPLRTEVVEALDAAIEDAGAEVHIRLFKHRAMRHARAGDWKKAAADFRAVVAQAPGQVNVAQQAAAAMLLGGERMTYEQFVTDFLAAQAENTNRTVLEKKAKLCVLPPDPIGDEETVKGWIAAAVEEGENVQWSPYFTATQALALYRYGDFEDALLAIRETDRRHALTGGGNNDFLYTKTRLVEALCHAKAGDIEKAMAAFNKADHIIRPRMAELQTVLKGELWHDWMIAKILHDEACEVIKGVIAAAAE